MTTDLRDRLDTLVADATAATDPAALWRAGARRRTRDRVAAAAGAATALLVAVLTVTSLLAPGARGLTPAGGTPALTYPQRISHQALVPDLPQAPGPLAGFVSVRHGESGEVDALTSTGRRYRMPPLGDVDPTLSDDGQRLAYRSSPDSTLHLRNLVTGGDVAARLSVDDAPVQTPLHWSPDGSRLAFTGRRIVVVREDGSVLALPGPGGQVHHRVVGWFDPTTLAVLADDGAGHLALLGTDADTGRAVLRVPLRGARPEDDQWTWTLSTDRTQLVRFPAQPGDGSDIELWSATTGNLEQRLLPPSDTDARRASWPGRRLSTWTERGLEPALPVTRRPDGGFSADVGDPVVVSDLDVEWLRLAAGAQTPASHPFGTRTSWWSWWWLEGTVCAAAAAALVAACLRLVERRSRPEPRPAPPPPPLDRPS